MYIGHRRYILRRVEHRAMIVHRSEGRDNSGNLISCINIYIHTYVYVCVCIYLREDIIILNEYSAGGYLRSRVQTVVVQLFHGNYIGAHGG